MNPRKQTLHTILLSSLVGVAACTSLIPEDESRLAKLNERYGDRFEITASDIYLSVKARTPQLDSWDLWSYNRKLWMRA